MANVKFRSIMDGCRFLLLSTMDERGRVTFSCGDCDVARTSPPDVATTSPPTVGLTVLKTRSPSE